MAGVGHVRRIKVGAHEQCASCWFRHVSIRVPKKGARENAHERAAGGTGSEQEMSEPLATCSKGNRHDGSRQHRLGSRALQDHSCWLRWSNTRRSGRYHCVLSAPPEKHSTAVMIWEIIFRTSQITSHNRFTEELITRKFHNTVVLLFMISHQVL